LIDMGLAALRNELAHLENNGASGPPDSACSFDRANNICRILVNCVHAYMKRADRNEVTKRTTEYFDILTRLQKRALGGGESAQSYEQASLVGSTVFCMIDLIGSYGDESYEDDAILLRIRHGIRSVRSRTPMERLRAAIDFQADPFAGALTP